MAGEFGVMDFLKNLPDPPPGRSYADEATFGPEWKAAYLDGYGGKKKPDRTSTVYAHAWHHGQLSILRGPGPTEAHLVEGLTPGEFFGPKPPDMLDELAAWQARNPDATPDQVEDWLDIYTAKQALAEFRLRNPDSLPDVPSGLEHMACLTHTFTDGSGNNRELFRLVYSNNGDCQLVINGPRMAASPDQLEAIARTYRAAAEYMREVDRVGLARCVQIAKNVL